MPNIINCFRWQTLSRTKGRHPDWFLNTKYFTQLIWVLPNGPPFNSISGCLLSTISLMPNIINCIRWQTLYRTKGKHPDWFLSTTYSTQLIWTTPNGPLFNASSGCLLSTISLMPNIINCFRWQTHSRTKGRHPDWFLSTTDSTQLVWTTPNGPLFNSISGCLLSTISLMPKIN
jgi:hypothetical protein